MAADLDITAAIRSALIDDGALGYTAKNLRITSSGGVVTLRGAANTDAEKDMIARMVREAAGVTRVENQLVVERAGERTN